MPKVKASKQSPQPEAAPAHTPEADFDDTIAHNRALKILDPNAVPEPPKGYRPTDPEIRNRRLRRLAGDLRSEAMDALREGGGRDLQAELGKYAPDPKRAGPIVERLVQSEQLVAAAQTLLNYAREVDQIAMSDALVFLEAENKHFAHAVEHEPALDARYPALKRLFAFRAGAISEGIARSKSADAAAAKAVAAAKGSAAAKDGEPPEE